MSDSYKKLGLSSPDSKILSSLEEILTNGHSAVLATVVATARSVPRHSGTKMLVVDDGRQIGTVGGGEMESRVINEAKNVLEIGRSKLLDYELVDPESGDPGICGGEVTIYLEPYMPPATILIIGCGHVGSALTDLAKWMGYHVIATDDRSGIDEDMPEADLVFIGPVVDVLKKTKLGPRDHAIFVTRNADLDIENLPYLLATDVGKIGVMGSARRWKTTRAALEDTGISREALDRIISPVGLDLGAETPEEIAVSIMGQILKNDRKM